MKLVLLGKVEEDLRWFNSYYDHFFPEGRAKAWARILHSFELLQRNPGLGKPFKQLPKRRYYIPRTAFAIYYQAIDDQLQIMRIWDTRRNIESLSLNETEK